ncbi:MAG: phnA protein [Verrucomicrobia bacterium]|nr:phnA protein [Verrucomicrobiota bacterium]
MAKGYDENQQQKARLNFLGKDLVRRSRAKCELCEADGVKLTVFEVPPESDPATADRCLFLCETCREQIENPKRMDADHWRCLNNAVWSEVPAVQVISARMLKRLSKEHWAKELLEQAYFSEEVDAWIAAAE